MKTSDEATMKAWVNRVKELMPKRGFQTYQQLAYQAEVSAGSLNQAMRGMHLPRQTTIEKIAKALDTTPQFLLYGDSMKVVKEVPILNTTGSLYRWLYDEKELIGNVKYLEVSGMNDLSEDSFGWPVRRHHMEPLFFHDDIVIFETIHDVTDYPDTVENYALVVKPVWDQVNLDDNTWGNKVTSLQHLWLFGRLEKTNQGVHVVSNKPEYSPIFLSDDYRIAGIAVTMIRSFKLINS